MTDIQNPQPENQAQLTSSVVPQTTDKITSQTNELEDNMQEHEKISPTIELDKSEKIDIRQVMPEQITAPVIIHQKGNGTVLAIGALVLSLIALGASGALFVQGQNTLREHSMLLEQDLNKAALGNSENAVLLQNTLHKQQEIDEQLSKILQNDAQTEQTLNSIHRAYAELLKGRVNWLVDEVETTLNAASQQLLLSGNVPVVTSVLETIEARLNRFEQPELLPIKQAISRDLGELKNRPYLNVTATVLRLERLENAISGLPLLVDGTLKETNATPEPVSRAGTFWTRAWDDTTALLKSMVEIRKLENNDAMLIAPNQVYLMRENIRLHLLDARLALLQYNGEVYQNDLNAIETTVKQYFDMQSPNTQAWLKELAELKALEVRMISDDALKASLAAVRDYQNNTRAALPVVFPETPSESQKTESVVSTATPTIVAPVASTSEPESRMSSEAASVPAAASATEAASETKKGGAA